jgi:Zn-dependent peptidase ImmA (M78 family)
MPNYEQSVRAAEELLARHNVMEPPIDVAGLIEAEGLKVVFKELEDRVSGFLLQAPSGAVVGVNSLHHPNRQRFTMAHELGHHHLHPNEPTVYVDDIMVHFRGEDIHAPQTATEIEANVFAASLLIPEKLIRRDLAERPIDALDDVAVRQLAVRYGVSAQALTIRLIELGMLSGMHR